MIHALHPQSAPEEIAAAWTADDRLPRGIMILNAVMGLTSFVFGDAVLRSVAAVMRIVSVLFMALSLGIVGLHWALYGFAGVGLEFWLYERVVTLFAVILGLITVVQFNSKAVIRALKAEVRSHNSIDVLRTRTLANGCMKIMFGVWGTMGIIYVAIHFVLPTIIMKYNILLDYGLLAVRLWLSLLINVGFMNVLFMCKLQIGLFKKYLGELKSSEVKFTVADLIAGHLVLKRRLRNLSGCTQSIIAVHVLGIIVCLPCAIILLIFVGSTPALFWDTFLFLFAILSGGDNVISACASFSVKLNEIAIQSNNLHARLTIWWAEKKAASDITTAADGASIPPIKPTTAGDLGGVMSKLWESDSDVLCDPKNHRFCCHVPKPFSRRIDLSQLDPDDVRHFVEYTFAGLPTDCYSVYGIYLNASIMRTLSSAVYAAIIIVVQPFIRNYLS